MPGLVISSWKTYTISLNMYHIQSHWAYTISLCIYLQYVDANNLYGWTIINNLATHGFKWEKGEDFTPEEIDKPVQKDKRGYILEVDLEYPKELHVNHYELPFLAERMKIGREEKLVPNLKDKKGYVVHIKALDQALRHG